ncbi:hypothetical protein SAMN04488065_1269 [Haloplanus vescus]|uniref:Uncharacterized protein n=1 Tax=Haloplanus vescus TaxID=555874 RepID=A0A1H3X003_9EURY|nr:hypothetical protein [Haloplanus vescus]SDZ92775.1 hypothetical protein SAMN04488065_1269 [Haloplanus vescus]
MNDSGSNNPQSILRFISIRWVELLGFIFLIAIAIDHGIYAGDKFINSVTTWASENNGLASVILSTGLLFAYLLQFRSQDRQRVLMEQQKQIMNAGYTPLIGVIQQDLEDHSTNPKTSETESLKLTIVNRGNSLATDLEVHFLITYDAHNQRYTNHSGPLRRTEDGVWWNSGSGGSLSPEESEVEFHIPVEVTDTKCSQNEPTDIADAINDIFDSGNSIDEIEIATQLRYQDAKGNQKEIDLTIYTIQSPNGDIELKLSSAADERPVRESKYSDEVDRIRT